MISAMSDVLKELYKTLEARKDADPSESYVASLYAKGVDKMSGKLAEEVAELICEAARGENKQAATSEAADVMFHLWVLLAHLDICPGDVEAELARRTGVSGHEEKRNRRS